MNIIRYKLEPTVLNGLQHKPQVMIDKIMQVEKHKVVGNITKIQLNEVEARLLAIFGVN